MGPPSVGSQAYLHYLEKQNARRRKEADRKKLDGVKHLIKPLLRKAKIQAAEAERGACRKLIERLQQNSNKNMRDAASKKFLNEWWQRLHKGVCDKLDAAQKKAEKAEDKADKLQKEVAKWKKAHHDTDAQLKQLSGARRRR